MVENEKKNVKTAPYIGSVISICHKTVFVVHLVPSHQSMFPLFPSKPSLS